MTLQIKVQKQGKKPIFRCMHSYKFTEECNGYYIKKHPKSKNIHNKYLQVK